jgi:hypothetical protein
MDRYIEWASDANHPVWLRNPQHWRTLVSGHYNFARKVSFTRSKYLLARLLIHVRTQRLALLLRTTATPEDSLLNLIY